MSETLPVERSEIEQRAMDLYASALKLRRRTAEEAWRAGEALTAAKKAMPHGEWGGWLSDKEIDKDTAARFMRLSREYRISEVAKFESIDKALQEKKKERRLEKRRKVIESLAQGEVQGRFAIVYADPPWQYDFSNTEDRKVENHYPTMGAEAIADMPVPEITTDDAVLFLWATTAKLPEALQVMEAWGFEYRSSFVWVKDKIGMGYWARGRHEFLLVGKKGSFPEPEPADRKDSVIEAPRAEHSEKPAQVAEMIEAWYPEVAKVELFCRSPREGWAAHGNQIEGAEVEL